MTWVKIDDAAPLHPKLLDAGAEAAWLWVAGLAHANRHTTDGRIERRHLAAIYPPIASKAPRLARKLVEVGLWIECGDGYRIHDYEDFQEQAMRDARDEKRARDAERARRYRDKKRLKPGENINRHAVTGRDASRVTSRDASRDKITDASRDVAADAIADGSFIYPGASRCPVPSRPDPTNSLSLRESESARAMPPEPRVEIAERYRREWRERKGSAAPRLDPFDRRVDNLVLLVREQMEIDGCEVAQVLDRLFPAFWGSERAEELGHAPGALASLFGELLGRSGAPGGKRGKMAGPAPARPHSDFGGGPDFDAMSDAELKAWFQAPPEAQAEVSRG